MTDTTQVVQSLNQGNFILTAILQALKGGVVVDPQPSVFTVAALPVTGANGQWAFASNGRKPGEGGGAGTGVPVFFNAATGTWFSYCSGAVITS